GELREQGYLLRHNTNQALDAFAVGHVLSQAKNLRMAGIRLYQPAKDGDGGGFAGAIWPQQPRYAAFGKAEGQPAKRWLQRAPVSFMEMVDTDHNPLMYRLK